MMGLAGLVSGCSISKVEESKVSDTYQNCNTGLDTFAVITKKTKNTYFMGADIPIKSEPLGFVEYKYSCNPSVELVDGEVKMKYILNATREGTAYHSVGLLSDGTISGVLYGLPRGGPRGGKW